MDTLRNLTAHLPEIEQAGAFQEILGENTPLIATEFICHSDFDADVGALALPGLKISACTLAPLQVCRPSQCIDDDGLILVILETGAATARQAGHEWTISAGEAMLTGNDAPATFVGHTPTRWINLRLDRRKLDRPGTDRRIPRPLPRSNHALRLLSSYVNLVLSLPAPPPHAARLAADHIYDLAALALGVARDREELGQVGRTRAARLAAALRIIRSDFGDPALAPAAVAARVGISTRYLHKLLQETGSSFSERVQDLRLAKAFVLLSGRDRKPARIIEAAHAAGFNDLSHFNRIFRRKYGLTPTAVRGREGPRCG